MSRYEYILLDWDGNLAKTLDLWLEAYRDPLMKRGLTLSDEEIAASFGSINKYLDEWGIGDKENVIAEADTIAKNSLPNVELYPDAISVLEKLYGEGKHLALITTSIRKNVDYLLEKYDLFRFFEVVITHEDTRLHKPHPDPLEKALELMNGTKQRAVMIGDSDKDILAAANLGIDSILFYPEEHKKFYVLDDLKGHSPTHIVSDFKQISVIV